VCDHLFWGLGVSNGDLRQLSARRPIYQQREDRIGASIFIAFLADCAQVTLNRRLRDLAPRLTARAVLEMEECGPVAI
jgi:hypothetical protein